MVSLPSFLKDYDPEKTLGTNQLKIGEVAFSGPTYQVEVIDGEGDDYWAFIQLDDSGLIRDSFCSCEHADEEEGCSHLAVAYLHLFGSTGIPLHERFARSIWNILAKHYAEKVGYDSDVLQKSYEDGFEIRSISGKRLFHILGKNEETKGRIHDILEDDEQETEETSLKFSNLPTNEIRLWRQGRPSRSLLYRLSFWNDLAAWLMHLEQTKEHKVSFTFSKQQVPNSIILDLEVVLVEFYIPEALLPEVIPALSTLNSPIPVRNFAMETIAGMEYDEKSGCFLIEHSQPPSSELKLQKTQEQMASAAIWSLNDWHYAPEFGFFQEEDESLLGVKELCAEKAVQLLDKHLQFVKERLTNTTIFDGLVELSYHLYFDPEWNLHIHCYLFDKNDLLLPHSRLFGEWAYIQGQGFYKVEEHRFPKVKEVVPETEVADFVTQNRLWLSGQPGFHPHLTHVETELAYGVDDGNNLFFYSQSAVEEEAGQQKDFGPWVYVTGQGFVSKLRSNVHLPVSPGVSVPEEAVTSFIRMNTDELTLVPGFFSDSCPVTNVQLQIALDEERQEIVITPHYEILPEYETSEIRYFGDYIYTQDEGFSVLPPEIRLPEGYRHTTRISKAGEALFLSYELEELNPYISKVDPKLSTPQWTKLVAESVELLENEKGIYRLKLRYHTDQGTLPVGTLWKATQDNERYIPSPAGLFDLQESRFGWLKGLQKNSIDLRAHTVTLTTMDLIRLNVLDPIHASERRSQQAEQARQLLNDVTQFKDPEQFRLEGLKCSLRPYQENGLRWLWFLYQHSLSGLLCDDMGLGKTHQAMALITSIRNKIAANPAAKRPQFLVVCPTSVIYHWQEKLQRFLEDVSVHTFYGLDRSLEGFEEADILLTSYGIWRREQKNLKKIGFELAIFDEVQAAKNQSSRLHGALQHVNARMRLGLTGTPIENHLMELKALFDIILPGYLPGEKEYREYFIKPIEKQNDHGRRLLLHRLIHPFLLRRKKGEVLDDLPDKTEEVYYCSLSGEQAQLYQQALSRSREQLIQQLQDEESKVPFVHIFAVLSQLKQICDHPAAYLKQPKEFLNHDSGKWEVFIELLSEARNSGQKVVVFTQYLAMLDIFEAYLKSQQIGYASIRGQTQNRGEALRRFNDDPECEIFLGSIQAVGLGVDLTAASVVIHYDRWWNAARENQATDRVHRIGQTRGVQVFKLVTRRTFEERIDELIASKGRLMEEVIGSDDKDVVKRLGRAELIELLADVENIGNDEEEA